MVKTPVGRREMIMYEFKKYKRTQIAEMRPVTEEEISLGRLITTFTSTRKAISVSLTDLQNGSPKAGDMIARNPKNHDDQWLVARQYFEDNFEVLSQEGGEESQWKPYPENKPKENILYLVQLSSGVMYLMEGEYFNISKVVAFRELPKQYTPQEGGEA